MALQYLAFLRKLLSVNSILVMQGTIRVPALIMLLILGVMTLFFVQRAIESVPPIHIEPAPSPTIDKNLFNYEGWKRLLLDALGRIREGEPLTHSQEIALEALRQKLLLHKASERELSEELLALLEMVLQANDQFFKNNPDAGQQRSDEEPQPGDH